MCVCVHVSVRVWGWLNLTCSARHDLVTTSYAFSIHSDQIWHTTAVSLLSTLWCRYRRYRRYSITNRCTSETEKKYWNVHSWFRKLLLCKYVETTRKCIVLFYQLEASSFCSWQATEFSLLEQMWENDLVSAWKANNPVIWCCCQVKQDQFQEEGQSHWSRLNERQKRLIFHFCSTQTETNATSQASFSLNTIYWLISTYMSSKDLCIYQ